MTILVNLVRAIRDLIAAIRGLIDSTNALTAEIRALRESLKPPDLRAVSWHVGPPEGEEE